METATIPWTFREFKAYLFLFAANSKHFETPEEKQMVHHLLNQREYEKIHREFEKDNDYKSIQKILAYIEEHNLHQPDLDKLLKDIRTLFDANHKPDVLEENMFLALKHLLHH